ncbi:MAG: peptidase family protein, partial [Thermoleophilia bacterium]|nr:peptidase family protein [Thermoleophilia bacterium]
MSIATSPVRNSNPGIVPPWLQGTHPVSPAPTAPTPIVPAPTAATTTAASSDPAAGVRELSRDALHFIPLGDGRVVVVDDGIAPGGMRRPSAPTESPEGLEGGESLRPTDRNDPAVLAEQHRIEGTIDDIRGFFSKLGVKDSEGNDRTTVVFNPRYHNASYSPEAIPEFGVPADSVSVGTDPRSGESFGKAKDVLAHEWTHRIVDHLTHGKLEMSPLSEDVAVHESLADTFAAAYDSDDWVIGDELVEPIRVMNDPEQLGHPDNVDDLPRIMAPGSEFMHELPTRDGGVLRDRSGKVVEVPDWHVIAGIPNKAASIIGDSLGRDTMAKIYLKAVREGVKPGQEIEGLASAVMQSASDLFGADSHE